MPDTELDNRILELASDFGKVWKAPATTNEDRKRLLGLLIEDITLTRNGYLVKVGLRLRGGRAHKLPPVDLPRPRAKLIRRDGSNEALTDLDALLETGYDDIRAAEELNQRGHRDCLGGRFNASRIRNIRLRSNLPGGIQRQRTKLRAHGYKTGSELAGELGICNATLQRRAKEGRGVDMHRIPAGGRHFAMYRITPETQTKPTSAP